MARITRHSADWLENERAFVAALSELRGAAAGAGLVLDQSHATIEGWPYLLHAEVRASGSRRVLSGIDVGLNLRGEMLLQRLPGKAQTFPSFRPRDEVFYLRSFGRLVELALAARAQTG
jgi:hypothetical protein